jgi:hypothetical protein
MNNEPEIQLPEPPTGHTWQYRGMGWNPGREIAGYLTVWDELRGDPAYRPYATPNGLADYHYWEAVASTSDIPLIEKLCTELDAAQGIAEALEKEVELLKMELNTYKSIYKNETSRADGMAALLIKCCHKIDSNFAADPMVARLPDMIEQLKKERDNWEATATDFNKAREYYRDLVIQCGQAIGKAAYTSDDGTTQEDVLCAKVPGLVKAMCDPALDVVRPHPEPDYAAEAKNILQRYFGCYADIRDTGLDIFVDLIIKAAKQ